MTVIIAGGRDFKPSIEDQKTLFALHDKYVFTEIVSGKAKGADTFGEDFARILNIPVKEFPADWKNLDVEPCVIRHNDYGPYNVLAGHNRNKAMAEYLSQFQDKGAIIFPGGTGTENMRRLCKSYNIPVLYK